MVTSLIFLARHSLDFLLRFCNKWTNDQKAHIWKYDSCLYEKEMFNYTGELCHNQYVASWDMFISHSKVS